MTAILLLGLLTGLDNLQVTPALGILKMPFRRKLLWALMFGLAEGLMPLLGIAIGHLLHHSLETWASVFGSVMLLLCGAVIVFMSLRGDDMEKVSSSKWTIIGLPLSLSIDNLLAGVAVGAAGAPMLISAVVIGGISTALGLAGLYVGHHIRRWLPGKPELFCGGYLVVLGVLSFFINPLS
jgi:putative Mn2+ efflux pump MntP